MDIHEINLGDTIKVDGKEVLVAAVVEYVTWKGILHETPTGFFLNEGIVSGWLSRWVSSAPKYTVLPNWKDFSDKRFGWTHSAEDVECVVRKAGETKTVSASVSTIRQERPCPQCGRKNDIGVSVCWHCERPNP